MSVGASFYNLSVACRAEKERNAAAQELEENVVQLQQDRQDKNVSEKNGKMIANNISDMTSR